MKKRSTQESRKSRKARTAPYQETYDVFLERLILAREAANLTQREVSARMGMAHSFVSKCETGERRVDGVQDSEWMAGRNAGNEGFLIKLTNEQFRMG